MFSCGLVSVTAFFGGATRVWLLITKVMGSCGGGPKRAGCHKVLQSVEQAEHDIPH